MPRLIGIAKILSSYFVQTRCWYPVKAVNWLTYCHTRSLEVWKRCAP